MNIIDPITFGMTFVGVTGGTLLLITALGKKITINEDAVKITMETLKFGTIFALMQHVFHLFM